VHEKLRQFTGRYPRIDDPLMRAAYLFGVRVSEWFYPAGTADWAQKATQVVLNEETVDYLYTSFTPLTFDYRWGSRPQLERIVNRVTSPDMTDRDKVMAILKYCHHDFREEFPAPLPENTVVLNASEEELLKLGGGQCEDRSRLIICLCQIAGIPARFVACYTYWDPEQDYKHVGGHAIVEMFIEGGWAFFDSLLDFYCVREDGRIASLWHLRNHPELVENQPEEVHADCGKTRDEFVKYRNQNLTTRQVMTLTNYSVNDHARYDWKWIWHVYEEGRPERAELDKFKREQSAALVAEIGLTP